MHFKLLATFLGLHFFYFHQIQRVSPARLTDEISLFKIEEVVYI